MSEVFRALLATIGVAVIVAALIEQGRSEWRRDPAPKAQLKLGLTEPSKREDRS